jgi:polyhydroxyalkanoate synthesis regulator phasin
LSEYTKTSAKLKSSLDEYTFAILKDSNIATKTELDRAYKDIYNLKKEVRELKKIIKQKEDK